jgi:hypothetical protein
MVRSRISPKLHESNEFYIVDYDFPDTSLESCESHLKNFYYKFEKTFGQKIAKFRSTASVLIVPTLDMALKIQKMISEFGGRANVRKCSTVYESVE